MFFIDSYDTIVKKVNGIRTCTTRKARSAKSSKSSKKNEKQQSQSTKETKSKNSSQNSSRNTSKKKIKTVAEGVFLNIDVDLFTDMLKMKLLGIDRLIISSLDSEFIRDPLVVLKVLLKAIGNANHVHVIILSYTMRNCIPFEYNKVCIAEENLKAQSANILNEVINRDSVEMEKLTEVQWALFKEYLIQRRDNYYQKIRNYKYDYFFLYKLNRLINKTK